MRKVSKNSIYKKYKQFTSPVPVKEGDIVLFKFGNKKYYGRIMYRLPLQQTVNFRTGKKKKRIPLAYVKFISYGKRSAKEREGQITLIPVFAGASGFKVVKHA